MKLMYCIDCKSMISIDMFARVCSCTHSYCKGFPNSKAVMVYGPCRVYAVKNSSLEDGVGKLWKVPKSSEEVVRVTELEKLLTL